MRNSEKRIAWNQRSILDAAGQLFFKDGFAKTTVDKIARAADCSKATVYVYFKNKDDIYYHIVLEYMVLLRDEIRGCTEKHADFETCYYAICGALAQFAQQYPMYFECISGKISVDPADFKNLPVLKSIYEVGEDLNDTLVSFLKHAQENGKISADLDPLTTMFVLWSAIGGLIAMSGNKQAYLESRLNRNKQTFLREGFAMLLCSLKWPGGKT